MKSTKKRRLWILALLFAGMLGALLVLSYRVSADFVYIQKLLSAPAAPCGAVEPRADGSADGNWIAVAWIQGGRDEQLSCKISGKAILRAATEAATWPDWTPRVVVFDGNPKNVCAIHTDVALSGSTAHVVTSVRAPCLAQAGDSQTTEIVYSTWDLAQDPLAATEVVTAVSRTATTSSDKRINDVRIALDGQGRPHIVYSLTTFFGREGEIMYHRNLGSGWDAETPRKASVLLSGGGGSSKDAAYRPQIAWGTDAGVGRVHLVWESHMDEVVDNPTSLDGDVYHRTIDDDGSDFNAAPTMLGLARGVEYPYVVESTHPYPALAARANHVVVAWNNCQDIDSQNSPCERFGLQYRRSTDNGATFGPAREALTGYEVASLGINREYTGTDFYGETSGDVPEYEKFARPALALDADGYPYLAWQVRNDLGGIEPYAVHTNVVTGTKSGGDEVVWADGAWDWVVDYDTYSYLMPQVVIPVATTDHIGMHLFYMQDDRAHPYRVFYDYLGKDRAIPTPTPTPRCGQAEDDPCLVYLPLAPQRDGQ
jgi:hypothetical protein